MMTEQEQSVEILRRCHRIARRYCGNDTSRGNELVNDIMELITFSAEETKPDSPMPVDTPVNKIDND